MDPNTTEQFSVKNLLTQLEQVSEQGREAASQRLRIWQDLMRAFDLTQDEMERFLVKTLNCQVITARRWITGQYTPRKLAILNLRRIWGDREEAKTASSELEDMVNFMGSKIAIRTLSHFFARLEHAKFCLCAKGWLGYKAGRYPGARDEMVRILTEKPELQAHYVFSPDSEAQRTLQSFLQYLRDPNPVVDPKIANQVHAWTTSSVQGENDGLRYNIASPFILVYSDDGAKAVGRSMDIWYELPVAAQYSLDGAATSAEREEVEYILVELPTNDALSLWLVWRELFVKIIADNLNRAASPKWENEAWRREIFGLLSLPNEYSGPGSSLEGLKHSLEL